MLKWTALTTLGLAGGLVVGLLIGMPLGQLVGAMIVTGAVTCLVGAVLEVRYWIPASAFALAIAFAASSLLVDLSLGGIRSAAGVIGFVLASGITFGALTSWPLRSLNV